MGVTAWISTCLLLSATCPRHVLRHVTRLGQRSGKGGHLERGRGGHQVHVAVDVNPVGGHQLLWTHDRGLELEIQVLCGLSAGRVQRVVDVVVVDGVVRVVQAVHGARGVAWQGAPEI